MEHRFIATFTPQAWIRDNAVDVDCEGPCHWDVTDTIAAASKTRRTELLKANSDASDDLRHLPNAPAWVRNWSGPFYVSVEEMDPASAAELLGQGDASEAPDTQLDLSKSIPDSDGRYGRGFRDALESVAMAMGQSLSRQQVDDVIGTALDAYGNNDDRVRLEISEVVVLSTAHLTRDEREAVAEGELPTSQSDADLLISMHGSHGAMIRVPDPDDPEELFPEADSGYSPGLLAALAYARSIGATHVNFDADGAVLADLPSYA